MGRLVRLPERRVRIEAPAELTFQVISCAGKTIERRSDHERVVEFKAEIRGRSVVTTEPASTRPGGLTTSGSPDPSHMYRRRSASSLRRGPECDLQYRGSFETPHGGLVGIVEAIVVRRMFDRAVREHLREAKQLAETRASRSMLFRRRSIL